MTGLVNSEIIRLRRAVQLTRLGGKKPYLVPSRSERFSPSMARDANTAEKLRTE